MKTLITIILFSIISISSFAQAPWNQLITTYETELYIDSTQIKRTDGVIYARIKTIYLTPESRETYVNNIKRVFKKNADKKIKKWQDFAYTITNGVYDCANNRFKIMQVEDYDSKDKLIIKTKKDEDKASWIDVSLETVGDYIVFSICDYKQ